MTFSEKIDDWIKEAETRPASALMILKLVAGRLRELTERNEELLAENIALQSGRRVEEYQKRLTHLEFQLEILKKRYGAEADVSLAGGEGVLAPDLLIYNAQGRVLRLRTSNQPGGAVLASLSGEIASNGEFPRIIAIDPMDQALLLFTSGRISTFPVSSLQPIEPGASQSWANVPQPEEPHAGEQLACIMPLSRLPLAHFILQVSRRGSVKKTLASMSESVMSNHYLGRGAAQKADQPFGVSLYQKGERAVLVTYEGRLLGLDVDALSYTAEERLRLDATDYIVADFGLRPGDNVICLTQNGKVIAREGAAVDITKSGQSRGQGLIPAARLGQGTRFIGAAAVRSDDTLVTLDSTGSVRSHTAADLAGAGAVRGGGLFLAMGVLHAPEKKGGAQ